MYAGTFLIVLSWSRRESNPYLTFRKRLFYPLNYGTIISLVPNCLKHLAQPAVHLPLALFYRNLQD